MQLLNRIEAAIASVTEGKPFDVDGITMYMEAPGILSVSVYTQCYYLENITKAIALEEIAMLKEKFSSMLGKYPVLSTWVADLQIMHCLAYNDYGRASFPICREMNNQTQWLIELQ